LAAVFFLAGVAASSASAVLNATTTTIAFKRKRLAPREDSRYIGA
jgi:hypothetical protein